MTTDVGMQASARETARTATSGDAALLSMRTIAVRLWRELSGERRLLLATVGSGLLAQLGLALAAVGVGVMVGRAASGTTPGGTVLALVGIGVATAGVATWAEMYYSHDLAYRVMAGMRVRLFDQLRRLIPSRTRSRHSGELVTTAMADVESLEWVFAHVFGQILVAVTMLTGTGTGLAVIDPRLLLVLLPAAAVVLSVPWLRRRAADGMSDGQRELSARLSSEVLDTVHGMAVLTSAGALSTRVRSVAATAAGVDRLSVRLSVRAGLDAAVIEAVLAGAGVVGLLTVIGAVRSGAVPPQDTPVVLALFGLALAPVAAIGGALRNLGTTRSAGTRICAVLDAPAEVPPAGGKAVGRSGAPALQMRGVRFGYRPDRPVLDGVDFEVRPGEIVALVGESGAGKSTAVQLAQRFFDVDEGAVEVTGIDVRELPEAQLRRRMTVVAQQIDLFEGSLRENLMLGAPDADEDRIGQAVRIAQLTEVVERLPGGLNGRIGDRGTTLSGGERARVALARAILPGPHILVLDEAVAGMDAVLESAVHDALRELDPMPAVLIVAHRSSTIAACDRVVRMIDGHIS